MARPLHHTTYVELGQCDQALRRTNEIRGGQLSMKWTDNASGSREYDPRDYQSMGLAAKNEGRILQHPTFVFILIIMGKSVPTW